MFHFASSIVVKSVIVYLTFSIPVAWCLGNGKCFTSVQNLRSVIPGLIYRSATLDNLSVSDARSLLSLDETSVTRLATVIDLRNKDEIERGKKRRTDGAKLFYSNVAIDPLYGGDDIRCRLFHIPILNDVDGFWNEAIDRMDKFERFKSTIQTTFQGGALDKAAARNLEKGGLPLLYTIMLTTGKDPIRCAMETCLKEVERGPIIFHCQKGKDRTGILALLIQSCLGVHDANILEAYALSDELLGGDNGGKDYSSGEGGGIDWSYFRGSPPSAMADTMKWVRKRYGSFDSYLDSILFRSEQRASLRRILLDRSSL